jgi:hypothetical protein
LKGHEIAPSTGALSPGRGQAQPHYYYYYLDFMLSFFSLICRCFFLSLHCRFSQSVKKLIQAVRQSRSNQISIAAYKDCLRSIQLKASIRISQRASIASHHSPCLQNQFSILAHPATFVLKVGNYTKYNTTIVCKSWLRLPSNFSQGSQQFPFSIVRHQQFQNKFSVVSVGTCSLQQTVFKSTASISGPLVGFGVCQ